MNKQGIEGINGIFISCAKTNLGGSRMADENEVSKAQEVNLSDFALFLSVMKNRTAYRDVLSIIMDEPDIEMTDVKVEEVVLNAVGKRAIRLDAWGRAADSRQFNIEMQNDTEHDDMSRRSRFYQAMLDTPVLKAGSETRYRQLPPTVVTFITQEDIFNKGLAKYTFEETCNELPELKLDDGTQKIFLNMSVKLGRPELISLLQYMKNTTLDNPDIVVKDDRIMELDNIVQEVKTSEEWEDAQMSILSEGIEIGETRGVERGKEIGKEQIMIDLVCRKMAKGKSSQEIAEALEEDRSVIDRIYDAAEKYAPEYDRKAIYDELHK